MPGDEMEITAGVGAFSRAAAPVKLLSKGKNSPLDIEADGAAHRKLNAATSLGKHTVVNVTVNDSKTRKGKRSDNNKAN